VTNEKASRMKINEIVTGQTPWGAQSFFYTVSTGGEEGSLCLKTKNFL